MRKKGVVDFPLFLLEVLGLPAIVAPVLTLNNALPSAVPTPMLMAKRDLVARGRVAMSAPIAMAESAEPKATPPVTAMLARAVASVVNAIPRQGSVFSH